MSLQKRAMQFVAICLKFSVSSNWFHW